MSLAISVLPRLLLAAGVCAPVLAQTATATATATATDSATRPYQIEFNFQAACELSGPLLPPGWQFHRPPTGVGSAAQLLCGPGGLGVGDPRGEVFLYNTSLFKTGPQPLTLGRYLLSGAGAGTVVSLRNGFGDVSFESRTQFLNLKAATPIVNWVEIDWDDRSERGWHGLLEARGTGLQWLRLEKLPATPVPPRTYAAPGAPGDTWTLDAGTRVQREADGVRLMVHPVTSAARIEQTFALPPGRYEVRSRARGSVDLRLSSGPTPRQRFNLVEQSTHSPLTQAAVPLSARFTATGQPVSLSLAASQAGQDVVVYPVEIRPLIEPVLTPQQRAAQRPTPWPARGMGVTDTFDLLPADQPPRDRNGVECAREVQPWSSNRAWAHHADFADLRRMGVNLIRLGVPTVSRALKDGCRLVEAGEVTAPGRVAPAAFWTRAWPVILAETAAVVQAAGAAGLKVVLHMEASTPAMALNDQPDGWANLRARHDFMRGFSEMAAHLSAQRQHVWAYELFNEPYEFLQGRGNVAPSQWRALAVDTIAAIRAAEQGADPRREPSWVVYAPVLQPSEYWARQYALLQPLPDDRVIYSEHYYDGFLFTHQNICEKGYPVGSLPYAGSPQAVRAALQPLRDFSSASGAPVYVGEFSAAMWAGWSPGKRGPWEPRVDAAGLPVHANVNWLRDVLDGLEADGFAWTYHSFRTYYAWNPELIIPSGQNGQNGPCGPFEYQRASQPDTPTMHLLRAYLKRNLGLPAGARR